MPIQVTKQAAIKRLQALAKDPATHELAVTYLALQAEAHRIRAEINRLYKPIFEKYSFFDNRGQQITFEQDRLYRCSDDALVAQYFEEIDQAVRAAGYDLPKNNCPALKAENNVIRCEWQILEKMAKIMDCEAADIHGETRDKVLKFFMEIAGQGL